METIFQDYILYYEARMKRWENNAAYTNAYAAEKVLYQLVLGCNNMEELQNEAVAFSMLSVQNAIALVKDQEIFRKKIYEECKEFVRAKASVDILEQLDDMQTDMAIVNMVNKVQQQNSVVVTVDELVNIFYSDFVAMENIEVYQQAEVPEEWKEKCKQYEQAIITGGKKVWNEVELPNARHWEKGWLLNYDLLQEERHRRLIPVNDEELKKKIALHKIYKPA